MKYCRKCGNEIMDEAVICPKCGCSTQQKSSSTDLKTIAFIFMIIGTVAQALLFFLFPLAWCLPMTLYYHKQIKNGQPVSVAFKVCTLLFVNTISGILMLCDKD